ncbi:MAG: protein of unknown function DUF4355 [Bacteriophage sp.]|jgi:hypothetical protein|nr:MAG: protein of unknown function DUF4355 [Bacteriophage sp.]DAL51865.1 MAG TPA_asm: protein of unknown function (DUF4355) [Caudoviricetes sp.]UVN02469.1 MAG: protein of unknown function DUF4355 [Bacteriophage sp.]UVX41940.1 MAG: protein of unknown function DUF4355 [Bacteriophage sp.]UVX58818.1 MAG: protein of unknown function DUF4355 [Bacteriophage sp.]
MENTNEVTTVNQVADGVSIEFDTTKGTTEVNAENSVTMSKADFNKAIQSAEDKLRGKYSKEIKELKDKIQELTPVQKSQAEIDLENRIAALEESERNIAAQKRRLDVQENLSNKGVDKALVDYLKDDADVDALVNIIDGIVKSRMKSNGYVPTEHSSDEKVTPEEFKRMTYSQKVELSERSPELFKRLSSRR